MAEMRTAADALYIMELTSAPEKHVAAHVHRLCLRHIELAARNLQYECVFSVPIMLTDFGLYDVGRVRARLVDVLRKDGFRVKPLKTVNRLYINWCPPEECRRQQQQRQEKEQEQQKKQQQRLMASAAITTASTRPRPLSHVRQNVAMPITRAMQDRFLQDIHANRFQALFR